MEGNFLQACQIARTAIGRTRTDPPHRLRRKERERGSAQGRPGARGRGSKIRAADHASTGEARNHPGEEIEWARSARRSPCTRRGSGPGKGPGKEIDPRPTRRPNRQARRTSSRSRISRQRDPQQPQAPCRSQKASQPQRSSRPTGQSDSYS